MNIQKKIDSFTARQRYELIKFTSKIIQNDKLKNSEILTPDYLVKEMLEKFLELNHVEKNIKVIEPCCGKGAFLIELLDRGFTNIDYADVNILNVRVCDFITGQHHGVVQDSLQLDYSKYDLVVTNPPYNSVIDNLAYKPQIYQKFGIQFLNAKYNLILTKATFLMYDGKQSQIKDYRKKLIPNLQFIKKFQKQIFQGVYIDSNVCYYIKTPEEQKHQIYADQNNTMTTLTLKNTDQIVSHDQTVPQKTILDQFELLKNKTYGIETNSPLIKAEGKIKCLVAMHRGLHQFVDQKPEAPYDFYKVVFPDVSRDLSMHMYVIGPDEIFNSTYIGFKVKDRQEGEKLIKYLKSDRVKELMNKNKPTKNITWRTFKYVPQMPE